MQSLIRIIGDILAPAHGANAAGSLGPLDHTFNLVQIDRAFDNPVPIPLVGYGDQILLSSIDKNQRLFARWLANIGRADKIGLSPFLLCCMSCPRRLGCIVDLVSKTEVILAARQTPCSPA